MYSILCWLPEKQVWKSYIRLIAYVLLYVLLINQISFMFMILHMLYYIREDTSKPKEDFKFDSLPLADTFFCLVVVTEHAERRSDVWPQHEILNVQSSDALKHLLEKTDWKVGRLISSHLALSMKYIALKLRNICLFVLWYVYLIRINFFI